MHLERVHLDGTDVVEVRQDEDVRVVARVRHRPVVEVPALGVVVRHRADERQLHVRPLRLDDPVGVDDAERVLPRVEARDLGQQRTLEVDAELVDDVRGVLRGQGHVLGGEGSIAGGQMKHGGRPDTGGTYSRRWKIAAS